MGHQIAFLHTEENIRAFLAYLEGHNGCIIIDGKKHLPSDVEQEVISRMNSFVCKFSIACLQKQESSSYHTNVSIAAGTAIEFLNCCKGNPASRTYEVGRLYIDKGLNGIYDPLTYALFKKLCLYIRKNYYFSSNAKVYFSSIFKQGYDQHYLCASRLGRPINF